MQSDITDPPRGPYQRLRAIGTRTVGPEHELLEIGWVDLVVTDQGCSLGKAEGNTLGPDSDGGPLWDIPSRSVPRMRPDLKQAIWHAPVPDALIVHDIAREQMALPASLTGFLPIISTYRVAVQSKLAGASGLGTFVQSRGLGPILVPVPGPGGGPLAVRSALLLALLTADLLQDAAVRARARVLGAETERLRPILGGMLGDPVLHGMLRMSELFTHPACEPPGPWDDEAAWAEVPTDDLRWIVTSGCPAYCPEMAQAELQRRARAGEPGDNQGQRRRVLLRQMAPTTLPP